MHDVLAAGIMVIAWGLGFGTGWGEKAKRVRRKAKRQAQYKVIKVGKNEQKHHNQ